MRTTPDPLPTTTPAGRTRTAATDWLVDGGDGEALSLREGCQAECKYRERLFGHLLHVATSPVDHETDGALALGGQRRKPAQVETRCPPLSNDQHIPRTNRLDAGRRDFSHGHRSAEAAGVGHSLNTTRAHASKSTSSSNANFATTSSNTRMALLL